MTIRFLRFPCLAAGMLLALACVPPSVMVPEPAPPSLASLRPAPGKSALVISRTEWFGHDSRFKTYLDKTFIGATRGKCFFAKTDIEPGMKFVSFWGENGVAVKVPFEAGKVYFLQENAAMGVRKARIVMEAVNAKRLDSGDLKGAVFYRFEPALSREADLTEVEFQDVIQGAETIRLNPDGTADLVP